MVHMSAALVVHRCRRHVLVNAKHMVAELVGDPLDVGQRGLQPSNEVGGGEQNIAHLQIRPWRERRLNHTAKQMANASQMVELRCQRIAKYTWHTSGDTAPVLSRNSQLVN